MMALVMLTTESSATGLSEYSRPLACSWKLRGLPWVVRNRVSCSAMHKMAVPWNPEVLTTITAFLSSVASMQAWLRKVSMSSPPPPSADTSTSWRSILRPQIPLQSSLITLVKVSNWLMTSPTGMAKPMPSSSSSLVRRWTMVMESSVMPTSVACGGESGSGVAVQNTSSGWNGWERSKVRWKSMNRSPRGSSKPISTGSSGAGSSPSPVSAGASGSSGAGAVVSSSAGAGSSPSPVSAGASGSSGAGAAVCSDGAGCAPPSSSSSPPQAAAMSTSANSAAKSLSIFRDTITPLRCLATNSSR